jgi:transcriptional regulator with XRE-family HTH domain
VATLKVGPLGEFIREQRRSAQISLRQLAESAGVSNPYLSQIERGLRKPSAEILQQIAKGLRISAETLYVRAGILDERVRRRRGRRCGPRRHRSHRAPEERAARHLRVVPARERRGGPELAPESGEVPVAEAAAPPEPEPAPAPDPKPAQTPHRAPKKKTRSKENPA